jgi:opacity protein-like surface antigen
MDAAGFLLIGLAALGSAAAYAQTDVAASLYGAFTGTTTGNGVVQSPSNSAGGLLEVRHISRPWIGYEGTYAFNRANQAYSETNLCPGINCPFTFTEAVSANAHEMTGDWVASMKIRNFRPFALAGGGILLNLPSSKSINTISCVGTCLPGDIDNATTTAVKPVFVYGAGLDWRLAPRIGLRLQYRGNLYKAPNLTYFTSASAFMHTAEPMIGIYFRF